MVYTKKYLGLGIIFHYHPEDGATLLAVVDEIGQDWKPAMDASMQFYLLYWGGLSVHGGFV